jgi:deoxyribodipyrimidine photo-lyase
MSSDVSILWLRQDLRLADNPALVAAAQGTVLPVYILDEDAAGDWALGGAQRWWLHHSLSALAADYKSLGVDLVLRRGNAVDILIELARAAGAHTIHATRHFEPYARRQEAELGQVGALTLALHASGCLNEPGAVATGAGTPFKVFTPYWRACQAKGAPDAPLPAPQRLQGYHGARSDALEDWGLLPTKPDWSAGLQAAWTPGEAGARAKLAAFEPPQVSAYKTTRDLPAVDGTSQLSAHLHFGEISARQVWHALGRRMELAQAEPYIRQLGWRDFSTSLLAHAPDLPAESWSPKFRAFPWRDDAADLRRWQKGETGYPIVDAGMRQLWQTGWMHNRVRMIVASFLCKHLLLHWRHGEDWFWDTLVDADLANNAAGWQWVAGSGADASPYFRIFNPITQAQKFDPDGAYIASFLPELADLPTKYIHAPWTAPKNILERAGVHLGETYPEPMVDHSAARARALSAYEEIKAA